MSEHDNLPEPGSHDEHNELLPYGSAEPIPDPGVPAHETRPTDEDPELGKRAERQVAGLFGLASLLTIAFVVFYFMFDPNPETGETFLGVGASNLALGLSLGLALLFIGIGAIHWAKKLMGDQEIVEHRHPGHTNPADMAEVVDSMAQGIEESGIARRPMIRNSLLGALGLLGVPAIVMLRDLGPLPGDALYHTVWRKGIRVVNDVSGEPIKPDDVEIGQLINAEPAVFFEQEGPDGEIIEPEYEGAALQVQKTKAAVIVVRMPPEDITPEPSRADWGVQGILCYSKICTHVGCPISLWEQQTHKLLCPCHQSTFDLADNGKVVFGPAARPLPQLHLGVDDEGYLIAMSDFDEPVGPSFWERG